MSIFKNKLLVSMGIVVFVVFILIVANVFATKKITLIVNGEVTNARPIIINGKTYLPLRDFVEYIGADAKYDAGSSTISVSNIIKVPKGEKVGDLIFSNFRALMDQEGKLKFKMDVTNVGNVTVEFAAIKVFFYDDEGNELGNKTGIVGDINMGETQPCVMLVDNSLFNYKTVKVQLEHINYDE
jgi:hypothetical protein